MKKLLLLLVLLISSVAISQKVKLKKGIVYIDGNPTYSYSRDFYTAEYELMKLNTTEVLVWTKYNNNNTVNYRDDDFSTYVFEGVDGKIISKSYTRTFKMEIEGYLKLGILDTDGGYHPEKVQDFKTRYEFDPKSGTTTTTTTVIRVTR